MADEKKKFEPFKTRPIRMSDKAWEIFKEKKQVSGKSWNQYILSLINKKSIDKNA